MQYNLEIKQIVKFPRVRIHRELIQKLMADQQLSMRGTSYLFEYMILCSYANYRKSRRMINGVTYNIKAGQWICSQQELKQWFRQRSRGQIENILKGLERMGLLTYRYLPGNKMILYQITDWEKFNTVLDYESRCLKDRGFFFFPVSYAVRLLEGCRASTLDALMDLWLNTIYMDDRVRGSNLAPIVYMRNHTGDPMTTFTALGSRWGISKATVSRMFSKLEDLGYLTCIHFSGNRGSVIILEQYLSTMFNICDVPVDKEELAFTLKMKVRAEDPSNTYTTGVSQPVSFQGPPVSKQVADILVEKVLQMLITQGFACCEPKKNFARISLLSDCPGFILEIGCKKDTTHAYRFEIGLSDAGG